MRVSEKRLDRRQAIRHGSVTFEGPDDLPRAGAIVAASSRGACLDQRLGDLDREAVEGGALFNVAAAFDGSAMMTAGHRALRP